MPAGSQLRAEVERNMVGPRDQKAPVLSSLPQCTWAQLDSTPKDTGQRHRPEIRHLTKEKSDRGCWVSRELEILLVLSL